MTSVVPAIETVVVGAVAQREHTSFSSSRISAFTIILLLMLPRFIDSTTWNSGQRLDNVNRTYLVLVSDKVALQKDDCCQSIAHIFQEKMRLLPLQEVPPGGHEARPAPLGEGEGWGGRHGAVG